MSAPLVVMLVLQLPHHCSTTNGVTVLTPSAVIWGNTSFWVLRLSVCVIDCCVVKKCLSFIEANLWL